MTRSADEILDEYLVLEAKVGSRRAFGQLVERWTPRLRRHAARLLGHSEPAQDAVQDAWLSIARGLRGLEDPGRFPAWAFGITTRRCIDLIRRRVRDRRLIDEALAQDATTPPETDPSIDQRLDLIVAITRLPFEQRLMVSLFYGEGLSVEAIATAHNLPTGTVKSRLNTARAALKSHLEGATP